MKYELPKVEESPNARAGVDGVSHACSVMAQFSTRAPGRFCITLPTHQPQ